MELFEKALSRSQGQTKQFLILTRHFFLRLFINDLVAFEEAMQHKVIALIAILAVISGHLSKTLLGKYIWIQDDNTSWVEKFYFILFAMLVIGFISVLEWDIIFPDRRDYANLIHLPIKLTTLFISKFASYFLFICLFALGITSLSTFVFWIYLPHWQSSSIFFSLRFVLVHLITLFSACLSVSFIFASLIGILMTVLGHKIFTTISVYIRSLMMMAMIFLSSVFLFRIVEIPRIFPSLSALKQSSPTSLFLFPPMWFVGLYETLLGNKDPLFSDLAKWSIPAVILPFLGFFMISVIGYRKSTKKMREAKNGNRHFTRIRKGSKTILNTLFIKNPIQRAVFYFFGTTIKKSNLHRMRLASYMMASGGIVLIMLVSKRAPLQYEAFFDKTLLSIPFILSFFLILGIRATSQIPVSIEANWIFKLVDIVDKKHYLIGLKKAIILLMILPLFVLLFVFYLWLWGWMYALLFCIYGFTISSLLVEIVFVNHHKIPFTCSYLPGKGKMHIFWIVYLFALSIYVSLASSIAFKLLDEPRNFMYFIVIVSILFPIIRLVQNRLFLQRSDIIYEEVPDPVLLTLMPEK
jgi:hypothetical protein